MKSLIFLYPFIELLTLIQLGIETSAFLALTYVLVVIFVGVTLVRYQGLSLLSKLQHKNGLGSAILADDMRLVLVGLLLVIPGLVSDLFAIAFLVGPLRRQIIYKIFKGKYVVDSETNKQDDFVIDGVFTRIDENSSSKK